VGWNVDSEDWREGRSAEQVGSAVLDAAANLTGSVLVLFHTWSAATREALPSLIEDLRGRGATFVTVAEATDGG
jgi:peptidoglycan/xylan/chitin deacetylase (PgdA/CDA1 family)